jgi:hypothetical protein
VMVARAKKQSIANSESVGSEFAALRFLGPGRYHYPGAIKAMQIGDVIKADMSQSHFQVALQRGIFEVVKNG